MMHSIAWRITGLIFLSIFITVVVLVYLANVQMGEHFSHYLEVQRAGGIAAGGAPERVLLESIHNSLYWVGGGILLIGLVASFILARSITIPLRKLVSAVEAISSGRYGQKVEVDSRSETGKLAEAFNRMSQTLADNIRLRQRLLADIVHELRTPMSVIQGNIEGMLEGVVEKDNENLVSLHEETIYINRIITDLRDLSLAEAGQLVLEKELTDVGNLIARAVNMLEPAADEKKILIEKKLAELPPVLIDPRRINQVIYNLLTNAIRYTPPNGKVEVASAQVYTAGQKWLQIAISDNGCGISPADLSFVFEHFYRADASRDKKSGGSGIGLAIVKRLTEMHGGRVKVESELGRGSAFTVILPVDA